MLTVVYHACFVNEDFHKIFFLLLNEQLEFLFQLCQLTVAYIRLIYILICFIILA